MITVFIRTIIMYIFLIAAIRLTGKRQIGELQVSELVVTFMLSELAVSPITDSGESILYAVIPIITLLSIEVIFSFLQTKSPAFRKILVGKPVMIIAHGELSLYNLKKNRLDIEELLGELRINGIFDISDVEYALLEENGKLSVLTKASATPITPDVLELTVHEQGFSHVLIADGEFIPHALSAVDLTEDKVLKFLKKQHLNISDVFLLTLNDIGGVTVFRSDGNGNELLRCSRYVFNKGDRAQ